jgi:glycine oxidase
VAGAEVIVVGGGLIGCAIARELAQLGARVEVIERDRVGAEASGAAAGMLGAQAETSNATMTRLGVESRALFREILAALRGETGVDVEHWEEGTLYLAFNEADEAETATRIGWQQAGGLPVERLAAAEARRLEPRINPELRSAVLFPDDGRVDNLQLTLAYAESAKRAGATVREGVTARRVTSVGGKLTGVETDHGAFEAEVVINAAGAWAAELLPERPLPVRPVRGQMLELASAEPMFRHALYSARGYAVARRDGRLLLGSTREEVGFDKRVTAAGMAKILEAANELSPELGNLRLQRAWAGLRPASSDGLPLIGPVPGLEGYFVATGHFGNGILLAPVTARLISQCIRGERPEWIEVVGPARFAGT